MAFWLFACTQPETIAILFPFEFQGDFHPVIAIPPIILCLNYFISNFFAYFFSLLFYHFNRTKLSVTSFITFLFVAYNNSVDLINSLSLKKITFKTR